MSEGQIESAIPVLILEALLDDEARRILFSHTLDNAETPSSEVKHLFLGVELVGFFQFLENAVEVGLPTRLLVDDGRHGDVERAVADGTYVPGSRFLRPVMMIPLGFSVIIPAHKKPLS